jgi:hypothetical protein
VDRSEGNGAVHVVRTVQAARAAWVWHLRGTPTGTWPAYFVHVLDTLGADDDGVGCLVAIAVHAS